MDERSRVALDLIRDDKEVSWVRDQLVVTFAAGFMQSAKERSLNNTSESLSILEANVTKRERSKREKYETSRRYDEVEKVELIVQALHEVFVTIPAIQLAVAQSLQKFGAETAFIEFLPPDEEEEAIVESAPGHTISMNTDTQADLRQRFEEFKARLES
jgi:hypothetical protein